MTDTIQAARAALALHGDQIIPDPALREALDGMLAAALPVAGLPSFDLELVRHAERIAAVILDIDGRVNA